MKKGTIFLTAILLVLSLTDLKGETADTLSVRPGGQVFEMLPFISPWLGTSNPASISESFPGNMNRFYAGFMKKHDDLRAVQQPETTTSYKVITEGYKQIGRLTFFGSFGYENAFYDGVLYNGTMKYNTINPYIVGDTVPKVQSKEEFTISGKLNYNLTDKLTLALGADYSSAVGAKQKDPRNKDNILFFKVTPGIIWKLGKLDLGFHLSGFTSSDEVSYSVVGNIGTYNIFIMRGLGYFLEEPDIDSYSEWYKGQGYGAGLQASFKSGNIVNIAEVTLDFSKEEVRSGGSYQLLDGIANTTTIAFSDQFKIYNNGILHLINLNGSLSSLSGDDIIQKSLPVTVETPTYKYTYYQIKTLNWTKNKQLISDYSFNAGYTFLLPDQHNNVNTEFGADMTLKYFYSGHYPLSNNGYLNSLNLTCRAFFKKGFLSGKVRITPGAEAEYRMNLSSDISYTPMESNIPELVSKDFDILNTSYIKGEISSRVDLPTTWKFIKSIFVDPSFSYAKAVNSKRGSLSNMFIHASAGVTF